MQNDKCHRRAVLAQRRDAWEGEGEEKTGRVFWRYQEKHVQKHRAMSVAYFGNVCTLALVLCQRDQQEMNLDFLWGYSIVIETFSAREGHDDICIFDNFAEAKIRARENSQG